jgi:hypothetical protein
MQPSHFEFEELSLLVRLVLEDSPNKERIKTVVEERWNALIQLEEDGTKKNQLKALAEKVGVTLGDPKS